MQTHETRVRIGGKQSSKGDIQLDFTVEAPTVQEAKELLSKALDNACAVLEEKGLYATHMKPAVVPAPKKAS